MQSLLNILAINEVRDGKQGDRTWQSQTVEAATLDDTGAVRQVGRLRIPKELIGNVTPGMFMGSFALTRDETREGGGYLVARLTGLQPYALKGAPK